MSVGGKVMGKRKLREGGVNHQGRWGERVPTTDGWWWVYRRLWDRTFRLSVVRIVDTGEGLMVFDREDGLIPLDSYVRLKKGSGEKLLWYPLSPPPLPERS